MGVGQIETQEQSADDILLIKNWIESHIDEILGQYKKSAVVGAHDILNSLFENIGNGIIPVSAIVDSVYSKIVEEIKLGERQDIDLSTKKGVSSLRSNIRTTVNSTLGKFSRNINKSKDNPDKVFLKTAYFDCPGQVCRSKKGIRHLEFVVGENKFSRHERNLEFFRKNRIKGEGEKHVRKITRSNPGFSLYPVSREKVLRSIFLEIMDEHRLWKMARHGRDVLVVIPNVSDFRGMQGRICLKLSDMDVEEYPEYKRRKKSLRDGEDLVLFIDRLPSASTILEGGNFEVVKIRSDCLVKILPLDKNPSPHLSPLREFLLKNKILSKFCANFTKTMVKLYSVYLGQCEEFRMDRRNSKSKAKNVAPKDDIFSLVSRNHWP